MKRFITYCRQRIAPRLSMDATQALQDFYVQVRDTVRQDEKARAIPITVRQLEALVRISESLAKMHLKIQVTSENVQEAIRLFKVSTMNASQDGGTRGLFGAFHEKAAVVEEAILKMVHVGVRMDTTALYIKLESQCTRVVDFLQHITTAVDNVTGEDPSLKMVTSFLKDQLEQEDLREEKRSRR
ncbi:hypothetical protein DYB35_002100 [Aphanomyces astaci]|uniref:DNA replication licensing factor MCM5 n=1 Tax=Aphanomyces astaci TaxID=112090 RepID=A0A418CLQ3_APHAT|nr:hypothetical protein DYB35_002100 [Aphanomyces astaci]